MQNQSLLINIQGQIANYNYTSLACSQTANSDVSHHNKFHRNFAEKSQIYCSACDPYIFIPNNPDSMINYILQLSSGGKIPRTFSTFSPKILTDVRSSH